MSYYPNKSKLPQYYKIGSKYDNQAYANKNINPEMNFLTKQLIEEERMTKIKKAKQLEEYSAFSNNYQVSRPITHSSKINYDNLTGKIGQERRHVKIGMNPQPQEALGRNPINQKMNGFNIINNSICGFYDPNQQFPKSSYQATYQGKPVQDFYKLPIQNYNNLTTNQMQSRVRAPMKNQPMQQPQLQIQEKANDPMNDEEIIRMKMRDMKVSNDNEEKEDHNREMVQPNMTEQEYQRAYEEYMRQERMKEFAYNQKQQQEKEQRLNTNQPQINQDPNHNNDKQDIAQLSNQTRPISEDEYKAYMEFIRKTEDSAKSNRQEPQQEQQPQPQTQMTEEEYYKYLQNKEQSSINPNYNQIQRQQENSTNSINDKELSPIDADYIRRLKEYEEIVQGDQQEKAYQSQSNTDRVISETPSYYQPQPQQQQVPNYRSICNQIKESNTMSSFKVKNAKTNYIAGNPYTGKNIDLGQSSLSTNPIVHPVNSYKFDYNRLQNPLIGNGRLMNIGNNIIDRNHTPHNQ